MLQSHIKSMNLGILGEHDVLFTFAITPGLAGAHEHGSGQPIEPDVPEHATISHATLIIEGDEAHPSEGFDIRGILDATGQLGELEAEIFEDWRQRLLDAETDRKIEAHHEQQLEAEF